MTTTRVPARLLPLLSAAALLVAAPGVRAQGVQGDPRLPSVELPAALERVLRDYERAWAAGDGAALAALFTDDGFIRRRSWIRGRDAIRERYDAVAAGPLRLRAVGFAAGDRVAHIVGAYGYGEAAAHTDDGVFVLALERGADGRWLIRADLDHGIPTGS